MKYYAAVKNELKSIYLDLEVYDVLISEENYLFLYNWSTYFVYACLYKFV